MARYQYETSPRKIRTDYEPIKKKSSNKNSTKKVQKANKNNVKVKPISKVKMVFCVLIGFAIFFTISYRNAVIDTKYATIKSLKSELATVQKENEQLEATIESSLNLKAIQQQAETLLGMKTLSNDQIEYVNLPKTDYVEAQSEKINLEEDNNYFIKIINTIKNLIK